MPALPMLSATTRGFMRTRAAQALERVNMFRKEEEWGHGVHVRLLNVVDPVHEMPHNLLQVHDMWVAGRKNASHRSKFETFTWDKAWRLGAALKKHPEYVSAFQAGRNRDDFFYGGAIKVVCNVSELGRPTTLIISVSGLNEVDDEAVAIAFAQQIPGLDQTQLRAIAKISGGYIARKLLDL